MAGSTGWGRASRRRPGSHRLQWRHVRSRPLLRRCRARPVRSAGDWRALLHRPRRAPRRPNAAAHARGVRRTDAVVGPGTLLRKAIEEDRLTSAIFWGPPGSGKSTLAHIIARRTHAAFENFSAVTSGVADLRKVIERARERRIKLKQKTILFVDEIHRWNKSQQDALLPHVEDGTVVLIGATTENPYFEVNAP